MVEISNSMISANYIAESYLEIPQEDFNKNAQVDVSKWVKKKQSLDYIPWGISKSLLKAYNNHLECVFEQSQPNVPYFVQADKGVYLLAYIVDKRNGKRTPPMFFPVRGFGNKNDPNPGMDLIGNAIQRAYAKCIAQETGLGWSLYSRIDESIDLDDSVTTSPTKQQQKYMPSKQQTNTDW